MFRELLGMFSPITVKNTAFDKRIVVAKDARSPDSGGRMNTSRFSTDTKIIGVTTFMNAYDDCLFIFSSIVYMHTEKLFSDDGVSARAVAWRNFHSPFCDKLLVKTCS